VHVVGKSCTFPTITATTSDSDATVSNTQVSDLSGTAKVVVTAEDGTTTKTYKIHFVVDEKVR